MVSTDQLRVVGASTSDAKRRIVPLEFSGTLGVSKRFVIVGASLTFVRLMVTAMVSSTTVSALPAASLLSRTFTVTL